ncbi:cilia- and flagella-associated protein 99-like [Clytia hemisphaerica]|uniref:Cilia- and flagella-associated protein 99 n=1 Tax=Clytia hemisphaerica TaxID=252671 RepID=A0A7M5X5M0_9CNID
MYKKLLETIIDVLECFDATVDEPQAFIEEYLQTKDAQSNNDFIEEIFLGCNRYDSILKVVVDAYFKSEVGRHVCLISDTNFYKVLCYISLFCLDDLGAVHFRKIVIAQQKHAKTYRFLNYLFDETKLKTWLFAEWCKIYDHSYVQINILSPVLRWLPEIHEFLAHLKDRENNRQKAKRDVLSPTEVKPFNLTKVKPRSVPIPEKIPTIKKHRPVPETTYSKPKEIDSLATANDRNRQNAERQLIDASINQFSCATTEKSAKTKERMIKYMKEEDSKLKFNSSKMNPLPANNDDNIPIRLNAATIMREGVLIQKKEEEEYKKLADLAQGGRDASEFLSWQQDMRRKDLEEKLAEIEANRISGQLSYEEAILARQSLVDENRKKVQSIKKETREMMDEFLKQKFQKQQDMRMLVEDIMEGHENAKEAKVKLKKYKQSIVEQVTNESKALMRKALEEAEIEMREKIALIAKIRAIESVPRIRCKQVDLTESSGIGLLGEMSVAELRERLGILKVQEKEDEEKKRQEIIQNKVDKNQYLMDTLESIAQRRARKEREAAMKQEERRSPTKREIKDPKVLGMQERLSAKRAEREKLRQISPPKPTRSKHIQLNKQKEKLEEMRWKELEKTREKAARLHAKSATNSQQPNRVKLT